MSPKDVRNWLGIWSTATLVCVGGYILLFGGSALFPMEKTDASDVLRLLVPTFMANTAIVYRWYVEVEKRDDLRVLPMPPWLVKFPPIAVSGLLLLGIVNLVISNQSAAAMSFSPEGYKNLATFSVGIMGVSTNLVMGRFFAARVREQPDRNVSVPGRGPEKSSTS